MKVVFLRSNPVAPDPRVEKEAKALIKAGYSVRVVSWNRNDPTLQKFDRISVENGTGIIERKFIRGGFGKGILNSFSFILWQIFLIYWLIKNRRCYEIIHSCDFDTAIPGLIMKLIFRKNLVYDIFDYYIQAFRVPKLFLTFIYILDKFILKKADAIIIVDENRLKQIPIPEGKKVEIIYNTPEDFFEKFKNSVKSDNNKTFKIAYVGILTRDRFLLEMIDIVRRYSSWELYIGGFGELEDEIKILSKKYRNIKFLGRIPYEETLKISSEADVLFAIYNPLIPNHKYSSPNKVFEAMMLGKPILVANGTGIDRLVCEEKFGFCVNYGDKTTVEEILKALEENPLLRKELGVNGRKAYERKYSWKLMEERLLRLYSNLRE